MRLIKRAQWVYGGMKGDQRGRDSVRRSYLLSSGNVYRCVNCSRRPGETEEERVWVTEAFISKRKQTLSLGSFHVVYVVLWMVAHIPLTDLLKARVLLLRVAHTDDTPYKPGERDINGHIREEPRKHCVRQASLNCEGRKKREWRKDQRGGQTDKSERSMKRLRERRVLTKSTLNRQSTLSRPLLNIMASQIINITHCFKGNTFFHLADQIKMT